MNTQYQESQKYNPSDIFKTLRTSSMMGEVQNPNWLIKGVVESNKVTSIFGPSGSFKSFAVLDMGLSIASGKDFHGIQTENDKEQSVLYICGEGLEGINKRVKAWQQEHNNSENVDNFFVTPAPIALNTVDGEAFIIAMLDGIKEATGTYPVQIIIDTLDRNFTGDENSSAAMSGFVDVLTKMRIKTEASVIVVHHTSKSNPDEARGSNVLRSGMDTEIRIKRDDKDNVYFENTKMKDEKDGGAIIFRHKVIKVGYDNRYNEDITSVVLVKNSKAEQAKAKVESIDQKDSFGQVSYNGLGKNQKDVLRTLIMNADNNRQVAKGEVTALSGKTTKQVREALAGLESKGIISVDSKIITLDESNYPVAM